MAYSSKTIKEEFLCGIELSCFVLTDGLNYVTFPMAKDYKRIGAEALDSQLGDNFTTSQRAGVLLYWIHTLRTEQE